MSQVIWKFAIALSDFQHVTMPVGARALYATEQFGQFVIYALCNSTASYLPRKVWLHGTGHPTQFSEQAQALGVVALEGGSLMFHVFIEPEQP